MAARICQRKAVSIFAGPAGKKSAARCHKISTCIIPYPEVLNPRNERGGKGRCRRNEVVKRSHIRILVSLLLFCGAVPSAAQNPPFSINSYTTGSQAFPTVCTDAGGNFVVVWESGCPTTDCDTSGPDGSFIGVFGRRFVRGGAPRGDEFAVNTYTTDYQTFPSLGCRDDGSFVVTWSSFGQDGSSAGVFGQRFDNSGAKAGSEFQVNSYTTSTQDYPAMGIAAAGDFVVTWTSEGQDGDGLGVFGQRFASDGNPIGSEFQANTYTTGAQVFPRVSAAANGDFVVVWTSYGQDGNDAGVFGQRFAADGQRVGGEFQVNQNALGAQYSAAAAHATGGDFVVVWARHLGNENGTDIAGRWYAGATVTPTRTNTRPPTATRTVTPTAPAEPSASVTPPPTATEAPTEAPTSVPTPTPIDTPTSEPTATPTDVDTPTPVPPSATPTQGVVGDCDDDGLVSINELVIGVNVALERVDVSRCTAFDLDRDGQVSINELVAAVRMALAS